MINPYKIVNDIKIQSLPTFENDEELAQSSYFYEISQNHLEN